MLLLVLLVPALRLRGRRRVGSLQAARARRLFRRDARDDDQPRADGVLEEPEAQGHAPEQARAHGSGSRRRAPRDARPHQARAAGRRRLD